MAGHSLLQLIAQNGTEAQQWSRPSMHGGAVHAIAAGKCLTVSGNGSVAVIQTCANPLSEMQTWTYHTIAQTYTVDSESGLKCLGASDSQVLIEDCNGAASQQWTRNFSLSMITNVANKKVLDLAGGATADGTTVSVTQVLLDSQGVPLPTPSQKWVWSLN